MIQFFHQLTGFLVTIASYGLVIWLMVTAITTITRGGRGK